MKLTASNKTNYIWKSNFIIIDYMYAVFGERYATYNQDVLS